MINILFVHQSAELYGSDKTLLTLLSKLDRTKFFPVVVLPFQGPLKAELEKENIQVVIAPVLKLYRKMFTPKNILLFFKEIKKAIVILDELHRKHQFDIIYSNTLAVLLGMIYARKRNIKHIWHVHEIIVHPKIIARTFPFLLKNFSDHIICNSKATKNNLTQRIPSLETKCIVIHNGTGLINVEHSETQISRLSLGFKEDDIIITLVGRISRLKGHKWLINTYINHLKGQNLKLLFVGSTVDGQEYYLEEVEQIIQQNALEEKVKIVPFTNNLNPVWTITDIAVVPSTEAESFGLVALEAMLAKRPVVASDHGGLTEIVVNNETGFLVEPNNERALYDAIIKLAENPDLRNAFGEMGHQRAINEFSSEKYIQSFEDLFLEIASIK